MERNGQVREAIPGRAEKEQDTVTILQAKGTAYSAIEHLWTGVRFLGDPWHAAV